MICTMAASRVKLAPSTRPLTTRPSAKTTRMISSPPTTWAAVRMSPCGVTITPLPVSPPSGNQRYRSGRDPGSHLMHMLLQVRHGRDIPRKTHSS